MAQTIWKGEIGTTSLRDLIAWPNETSLCSCEKWLDDHKQVWAGGLTTYGARDLRMVWWGSQRSATHTVAKECCTTFSRFLARNMWNTHLIHLKMLEIIGSCWLRPHASTAWQFICDIRRRETQPERAAVICSGNNHAALWKRCIKAHQRGRPAQASGFPGKSPDFNGKCMTLLPFTPFPSSR